jgi:hypothetical protein
MSARSGRPADYKSAIQQVENLRYGGESNRRNYLTNLFGGTSVNP